MNSIKMIYLKKLSTGSDEHEQHQRQLEQLLDKIKSLNEAKKRKENELKTTKNDKDNYRIKQNEIKEKLEKDLHDIHKRELDHKNRLNQECEAEMGKMKQAFQDKVTFLFILNRKQKLQRS